MHSAFGFQWSFSMPCEPRCAQTHFLCLVEGVHVLQRCVEQLFWRVSKDHGQTLARLQISVWGRFLLMALYFCGLFSFLREPLDFRQRFPGEAAERIGAWGREQVRHLCIAKGYRRKGVSLGGAGGRMMSECREHNTSSTTDLRVQM